MEDEQHEHEESFPDGLDPAEHDTTRQQWLAGRDQQGFPWNRLNYTREAYREQRVYQNYMNVVDIAAYESLKDFHEREFGAECTPTRAHSDLFSFYHNFRDVKSTFIHFQLRNLVWATSAHDVYVTHENCIKHWNMVSRKTRVVLDLTGGMGSPFVPLARLSPTGAVHISTCCVGGGIVAAGGFNGELVVTSERGGPVMMSKRVSENENSITNSIEISQGSSGAWRILSANNDDKVRLLDVATCKMVTEIPLDWAANYSTANPTHRNLLAVVGDDKDAFLHDTSTTKRVAQLTGHLDYSFAAAWHPSGNVLATGNQDCTTRVWDMRRLDRSLALLKGRLGSIRSCRFSADGKWLATAEPADFVHVYAVGSDLLDCQCVDLFGEISGISFTPDSDALMVAISDQSYNSLLCYRRNDGWF